MTTLVLTVVLAASLLVYAGAHGALVAGLARETPRWRALVALLVPPLAPLWGWKAGMRARVITWGAALALYAIAVILAAL